MSQTKRWIEEQREQGIDVLQPDTLNEPEYCNYSGLPSMAAYQIDQDETETRNYTETA